jgi:voltage-gated potassium channel
MTKLIDGFFRDCFSDGLNRKRYRRMNLTVSILVFINVILLMVSTLHHLAPWLSTTIRVVNAVITVIFAFEYLLRMRYTHLSLSGYIFRFTSVVDIISIYPAFLSLIFSWNISHMTMLRLLRVVKFFRTTKTVKLFKQVMQRTYRQLGFAFSMVGIVILIFSSLLYYAEGTAQPEAFANIFDCIWWVISALTTAGYISVYPMTILGKIISSMIVILGISLFAVPAGIITAGFIEEYKTTRKQRLNTTQHPPD